MELAIQSRKTMLNGWKGQEPSGFAAPGASEWSAAWRGRPFGSLEARIDAAKADAWLFTPHRETTAGTAVSEPRKLLRVIIEIRVRRMA
jgi:hypothetical protein